MARMAFTVVGGVVGSFVGMPQLGALIGSAIGGLVESASAPNSYGPRLSDTSVSVGSYGSPIGIAEGIGELGADVIWVQNGEKEERESSESAGGKGGGPSFITYQYFGTWAVLVSDNPIAGVRRIWLGRDLVYDATSEVLAAAISAGDPLPLTGAAEGFHFRLYTGTSDQMPDPAMQAEDPFASGMRGMSYLVIEDLALEPWGNEFPPVMVEVVTVPATKLDVGLPQYTLSEVDVPAAAVFDPARGRLFAALNGIEVHVYDVLTGVLLRTDDISGAPNDWYSASYGSLGDQPATIGEAGFTAPTNRVAPCVAPDGSFYIMSWEWQEGIAFGGGLLVDAETGLWLATLAQNYAVSVDGAFGLSHGPNDATSTKVTDHVLRSVDFLPPDPATGLQPFLYLRCVRNGYIYYGPASIASRGPVQCGGLIQCPNYTKTTDEFFCDVNAAGDVAYAVYLKSGGDFEAARIPLSGFAGAEIDYEASKDVPDFAVTVDASIGNATGCLYDNDHDTFTVIADDGVQVFDADLTSIAVTVLDIRSEGPRARSGNINSILWFASPEASISPERDLIRGVSTATGEVIETHDLGDWGLDDESDFDPVWQLRGDTFLAHASVGGVGGTYQDRPALLFGDRFELDKIPLADVLLDLALRAGMTAAQLDLTAVTRLIYGAPQKAPNVTARGAWEDLLLQTDHFAAMIDGKLTVKPRLTSTLGTITDIDLGADGGPSFRRRTNASALVRRLELAYKSTDANLERALQADEFPVEVTAAGDIARLETALVMDDDEAWQSAQRLLAASTSEKTEIEFAVPYARGDIEPGDIWTLDGGADVVDVRIGELSGEGVLKMKGTNAAPLAGTAATPIDFTRPPPTLAETAATDFELIDAHMWRDGDDGPGFIAAAWPRRSGVNWGGGVIYRSSDPLAFNDEFAALTVASKAAAVQGILGDIPSANYWDRVNELTVQMISGTPEAATEAQVLAGANPVWVQCGALAGEWELIQFADAVENGDGTWTLSTLLRGRRGTEHLTGEHTHGDRAIWADAAAARRVGGASVGVNLFYLSASIGARQDASTKRSFTNHSRGLRPYSVADVRGARDGSKNLTVTWVRRSRLQGAVDRTTVPLGEDAEEYEVDIMDGSSVVRTISGLSSETAAYTAAQQVTDFGAEQNPVTVRVYQISAAFGRGVVREVDL